MPAPVVGDDVVRGEEDLLAAGRGQSERGKAHGCLAGGRGDAGEQRPEEPDDGDDGVSLRTVGPGEGYSEWRRECNPFRCDGQFSLAELWRLLDTQLAGASRAPPTAG